MSLVDSESLKYKKYCLLVFRNKKINNFENVNGVISAFAGIGYNFDKISYVAYDSNAEIVRALKDGKEFYENIVVCCPTVMESTLKSFIGNLYSSEFNELGILKYHADNVFILYTDKANRLTYEDIKKVLDCKYGEQYSKSYIKTVGAPRTLINTAISEAKSVCPDIDFNVSDSFGNCRIEIVYSDKTSKILYDQIMRKLITDLNEFVYAMDDISLAERLFQLLKLRRMKISVAESFTGGGIGKALVEVPGISEVYFEGLNTYSNEAKMLRLGVKEFTLKQYGAVSEETAREMAEGLIKTGNCDISIATTGIAGPKSDNTSKPVGLNYIAVGTRDKICVYKYNLKGDRETITNTAINLALFLAFKMLK